MAMAKQENRVCFVAGKDLEKMINQRAKQEGITVSEYLRESIYLEMIFSGDVEAAGFVFKRVGKRIKDSLVDRIGGTDIRSKVDALTAE
jgi:hypothetical protein